MKRTLAVLAARLVTGALFASAMAAVFLSEGTARGGTTYPTVPLLEKWDWLDWAGAPWLILCVLLGPLLLAFWPITSWAWNTPITPQGVIQEKERQRAISARDSARHRAEYERKVAEITKRFGGTT